MSQSGRKVMVYMSEETVKNQNPTEENVNKTEVTEQMSENKNQTNDNFKYRLERAKEQGVKQVLTELGVTSIEEVKEIYKKLEETTKNYQQMKTEVDKSKVYQQKLEVLKSGFDEKFVDFIVHEVGKSEDFSKGLEEFKRDNPQYLKNQETSIKYNTSPNFENHYQSKDISKRFNEVIYQKICKEK